MGRSGAISRQRGWQVHKNLEEQQALGEEMPSDAWKELPKVMRHSLLSVLTHDTAHATHSHLPSLAPIYLYSSLNIIYNETRCQVSPLWVFVLL